jgi:ankyrin repeat protein
MGLKALGKDVIFRLRSKAPKTMRKTRAKHKINKIEHGALSEFPLVSASDIGIFALLDLPIELVETVISYMVDILGVFRAVRLRVVNSESAVIVASDRLDLVHWHFRAPNIVPFELTYYIEFFGGTIIPIIFSRTSIRRQSDIEIYPDAQSPFGRILETRIEKATFSPRSSLARSIHRSIVLLESLSDDSSGAADRRSMYQKILCRRAVFKLGITTVYEDLSSTGERRLARDRSSSTGALIIASAMSDAFLMRNFITHVDQESHRFGTALDAAAEYGHIDAVKMLLKHEPSYLGIHYDPLFSPIRKAIQGGHKDIVKLFLEEHQTAVAHSKSSPHSELDWFGGRSQWEAIFRWAACYDQTDILYMVIQFSPYKRHRRFLESALYEAVNSRATSTIESLLEAGVSMSGRRKWTPHALQRASARGDVNTVRLLLEHGFEHGNKLAEYQYYLYLAAERGHTEVLELFLDIRVDINGRFDLFRSKTVEDHGYLMWMRDNVFRYRERSPSYELPTATVASRGDFHMFCFLVRKGAKVDLEGEFGPLQQLWLERIWLWEAKCSTGK